MLKKMYQNLKNLKEMDSFVSIATVKSFFAFVLLIVLFIVTSMYFSGPDKFKEKQHALLKKSFEEELRALIQKKHPEVIQVLFENIRTKQTKNPNKVEIHFKYLITLKEGENRLEASALLHLMDNQVWQIQDFQILKNRMSFSESISIKAKE